MGTIGLVLAILSVLALVQAETPIGKNLRRVVFLSNENFLKFQATYQSLLFYFIISFAVLLTYFILIYFSFFTVQKMIFNILYMGCLLFAIKIFLGGTSPKILDYEKLFLKFFLPFLIFIALLFFSHEILENKFTNGDLEKVYTEFKKDDRITLNALDTMNALELRNYFSDEYKLNAGVILLNEYRNAYEFQVDFEKTELENYPKISNLISECSLLYHSRKLDEAFLERISNQLEFINNREIGKIVNVFPPQVQPNFVSSNLVFCYPRAFATLAKGSKILLTNTYLKIVDNIGKIGFYLLFPGGVLISIILTRKLDSYNLKHGAVNEDSHGLFFMFVSVFGMFVAILSII